ncbi:MAG: calcium/sodium antiporter [Gammaproteobacteria bacterium]|nr:MAG: calcium/sodium antiporter [Gammaproteobacteria bacterium]
MLLAFTALIAGLVVLAWSADKFVDGASATATHLGMSPLLVGILIIGFGTSAPEMVVSALAALDGNPNLAVGNAVGSNIANIALILGLTALISPITVHSGLLRKELPLLLTVTALLWLLFEDSRLDQMDAWVLLLAFGGFIGWSILSALNTRNDHLTQEMALEAAGHTMPLRHAIIWLVAGGILLVVSSRALVWGAVTIAQALGVSDLIIGLTIVAFGTSLPELASSIAAARKGEHDLAVGNIVGSNLFNTLAVIGIAGAILPSDLPADVLYRDLPVMSVLTLMLMIMGIGVLGRGRINRIEGGILLSAFLAYDGWLIYTLT